jgi:hypothetical protein
MSNFFVIGLPRSRTAWLANFLTYDGSFCYHEGLNGCSSVEEYKQKLGKHRGDSCTGLTYIDMNKEFPDAPKLIVESSVEDSVEFAKKIYNIDLSVEFQASSDKMKLIKGMRVKLKDINNSLEEIWKYLIGTPYNKGRGDMLNNMEVTTMNYFDYDVESARRLICLGEQ